MSRACWCLSSWPEKRCAKAKIANRSPQSFFTLCFASDRFLTNIHQDAEGSETEERQ
jgi:hypothetical protein